MSVEPTDPTPAPARTCFVISPIGKDGSETRIRADQVLKYIIRPTVERYGYRAVRADEIVLPGRITTQVVDLVLESELVVADLTERNANVYYELCLRHATRRPVIHLIDKDEDNPFDIIDQRTIRFTHRDLDSVEMAKQRLADEIEAIHGGALLDTPIAQAIDLSPIRRSADPEEAALAQVIERLGAMSGQLGALTRQVAGLEERTRPFSSLGVGSLGRLRSGGHLWGDPSSTQITLDPSDVRLTVVQSDPVSTRSRLFQGSIVSPPPDPDGKG